jgi:four helix bundle protein
LRITNCEFRIVESLVVPDPEEESVEIVARTYRFALSVVLLCQSMSAGARTERPIVSQLIRAGTSVGAMVEEAQSAESRADFRHKMSIAAKEARETVYWLRLCSDAKVAGIEQVRPVLEEGMQVRNILRAIVKKLRSDVDPS